MCSNAVKLKIGGTAEPLDSQRVAALTSSWGPCATEVTRDSPNFWSKHGAQQGRARTLQYDLKCPSMGEVWVRQHVPCTWRPEHWRCYLIMKGKMRILGVQPGVQAWGASMDSGPPVSMWRVVV